MLLAVCLLSTITTKWLNRVQFACRIACIMDRAQTDSMNQLFFLLAVIRRQTAKCFNYLYISDWCCVIEQLKWDLKRFMAGAISDRRGREMAFQALRWCFKQIAQLISWARLSQSSGIQFDLMAQLQASRVFGCLLMTNILLSSSTLFALWAFQI